MLRPTILRTFPRVGVTAALVIGLVVAGGLAPAHADSNVYIATPAGTDVSVATSLDGTDITATFSEVAVAGNVYLATTGAATYDTSSIGDVSAYVYLFSAAGAEFYGGTVRLCLTFDTGAGVPTLYSYVNGATEQTWTDITTPGAESGVVCGIENGSEYSGEYVIGFTAIPIVAGPLPVTTPEYEISLTSRFGYSDFTEEDGPLLDLRIVNPTDTPLRIGFGVDLAVQGVPEKLWLPDTWGVEEGLAEVFETTVDSGQIFELTIPDWPGKTYGFYLLPDVPGPADEGQLVGYSTTTGGFVAFVWDPVTQTAELGREATVAGAGTNPELFRGVTATVIASGLTPGENLQMYLAPGLDYFWFYLLGAILPTDAINVGSGTVGADGVLSATFQIPADAALTSYQLVIGDPFNRYWPAGSYQSFRVTIPSASNSASTPTGANVQAAVPLGATFVDLLFPNVTSAGSTTVSASTTGPVIDSFILGSQPQIYYHIDTTAGFTGLVEVCITYDPLTLSGGIPWLYHHKQQGPNSFSWQNITTSRVSGKVCGLTDSFSPFTLGYSPNPEIVLSNKDQCKQGGWATSTLPIFRNQGDCVSQFANTEKKPKKK